jgi:hypothetical protein
MTSALVMLLKSVAVVAASELSCERARSAIRAATDDLDVRVLAGDWRTLAWDAAWLLDLARRGQR